MCVTKQTLKTHLLARTYYDNYIPTAGILNFQQKVGQCDMVCYVHNPSIGHETKLWFLHVQYLL